MQKRSNVVVNRVGKVISGAEVTVKTLGGSTATIYSSDGGSPTTNPVPTDSYGRYSYYAADGRYTEEVRKDGVLLATETDILLEDPADGSEALAATTGSGLIGFDYSLTYAAGTIGKWLKDLATSVGAAFIGTIQSGAGAVLRTVQAELRDRVSPKQFGAVADGTTDDTAALLAATATGKMVDGLGLTYAVTGNFEPHANFVGMVNMTLKQLTPTGSNRRTLFISGRTGFYLRRVYVNRNGNLSGGSINDDAGIWIAGCSKFAVVDIGSTGGGAGNGVTIQSCFDFYDKSVTVHDERYTTGSVPADDVVNGIWYNNCYNFVSYNPYVYDCGCLISAVASKRRSRGIAISGCYNFAQFGPRVVNVDQGHDITGTVGNHDFLISGGIITGCYSYSFKAANSAYRGRYESCTGDGAGINFVCSGPTEVSNPLPRDITYKKCISIDAGKSAAVSVSYAGFRIMSVGAVDATYPRGITYDNCQAIDTQGSPTMLVGFNSDVVTGNAQADINRLVNNCKAFGFVTSATNGFSEDNCITGVRRHDGNSVRACLFETDAGADEKMWDTTLTAGVMESRTRTDADGSGESWRRIERTGTGVTLIRWNATAMRRGGVADTERYEESDASGRITQRFDDNSLQNIFTQQNFGITASGQGLSKTITFGAGGVSGATAFKLDYRTTADWSSAGNRSSELRMSVALAGVSVDAFRVNPKYVGYGALPMRYCLAQSAVAVPLTGTTSKTTLATIAIPAGSIGPNGTVHVTVLFSMTNSANNKSFTVELDGTTFYGITLANQSALQAISIIRNRNSEAAQAGFTNSTGGIGAASLVTATVNTAVAKNLTITGTLANSGETITLEGYTVEIMHGA